MHAHDRPADLGARLLAKGFEQGGRETLMVRPVGTDDAPASPAGIDIRRVTDPALLADLVAVETEVWNDDNSWLAGALAAELAQDPQALAIYIAYAGADAGFHRLDPVPWRPRLRHALGRLDAQGLPLPRHLPGAGGNTGGAGALAGRRVTSPSRPATTAGRSSSATASAR